MKKINVNGIAINVASGFSVSISADGTVNIDKDFEEIVENVPVQHPIEYFQSDYQSNVLPDLKFGDVAKQCRAFIAGTLLDNKIIAHAVTTVYGQMSKLTDKMIIVKSTDDKMVWEVFLEDKIESFDIVGQVEAFTDIGQTLPIKARSTHSIRTALYKKGLSGTVKTTTAPEWFMVTTKEHKKRNVCSMVADADTFIDTLNDPKLINYVV